MGKKLVELGCVLLYILLLPIGICIIILTGMITFIKNMINKYGYWTSLDHTVLIVFLLFVLYYSLTGHRTW